MEIILGDALFQEVYLFLENNMFSLVPELWPLMFATSLFKIRIIYFICRVF